MGTEGIELARLLALVNVAMADAAIAIWESKFHYDFWRPVTGIRESAAPLFTGRGSGEDGRWPGSTIAAGELTGISPLYPSNFKTACGAAFDAGPDGAGGWLARLSVPVGGRG